MNQETMKVLILVMIFLLLSVIVIGGFLFF